MRRRYCAKGLHGAETVMTHRWYDKDVAQFSAATRPWSAGLHIPLHMQSRHAAPIISRKLSPSGLSLMGSLDPCFSGLTAGGAKPSSSTLDATAARFAFAQSRYLGIAKVCGLRTAIRYAVAARSAVPDVSPNLHPVSVFTLHRTMSFPYQLSCPR